MIAFKELLFKPATKNLAVAIFAYGVLLAAAIIALTVIAALLGLLI